MQHEDRGALPEGWNSLEDGGAAREAEGRTFRVAPPIEGARGPKGQWQLYVAQGGYERYEGNYPSMGAAIAEGDDIVQGIRDAAAMGRETTVYGDRGGTWTKWGKAQTGTQYARGIMKYTTSGHGGFKVSPGVNGAIPDHLRLEGGVYEEDGDWARLATAMPQVFTDRERRHAERILRNGMPDAWEIQYGRRLQEGESVRRDQQRFLEANRGAWIVTSAIGSKEHPGQVLVTAAVDGVRSHGAEKREFLVPQAEYAARDMRLGFFAIDPARHPELEPRHALAL